MDGVRLLTDPVLRSRVMHLRRSGPAPARRSAGSMPRSSRMATGTISTCRRSSGSGASSRSSVLAASGSCCGGDVSATSSRLTRARASRSARWQRDGDVRRARRLSRPARRAGAVVRLRDRGLTPRVLRGRHRPLRGHGRSRCVRRRADSRSGWGSKVGPGHLDPARAVEAVERLRPKLAIPIHWGTYTTVNRRPTRSPRTSSPRSPGALPDVESASSRLARRSRWIRVDPHHRRRRL